MQKIVPNLWFDKDAEEAVNLYVSLFKDSKIKEVTRYDAAGAAVSGQPEGSVLTISFELQGQEFIALNGGPIFKFTEAISLLINCETQEEMDMLTEKLSAHPESEQCGWVKDKYGLSWQITPTILEKMLKDPNPRKAQAVMKAMLAMKRLNIVELQKAYDQA